MSSSLHKAFQFTRRHARMAVRESICPGVFYVTGGRLWGSDRPLSGVESLEVGGEEACHLPAVRDALTGAPYPELKIHFPAVYTHRVDTRKIQVQLLQSGGVLLNSKCLLAGGIHPYAAMWEAVFRRIKPRRTVPLAVIPWAHPWYTFGDFTTIIFPVLARLQSSLSAEEKGAAVYLLPGLAARPWVRDFCSLLGIEPEQLVDPVVDSVGVEPRGIVVTSSGLPRHSTTTHPADFRRLQESLQIEASPGQAQKRIYVPRSHGRCLNDEAKILPALREAGFFICPERLSAKEQVELFGSASLVCGPHGGALGNIIFSPSGCRLFEFQHPLWMQTGFRSIAHFKQFEYGLTLDTAHRPSYKIVHGYAQQNLDLPIESLLDAILRNTDEAD